ncbi:MAG: nucleotidyltransferase domain-containing protein [Halobacteriota archaeon]
MEPELTTEKRKGGQPRPLSVPGPIYAGVLAFVQAIRSIPTLEAVILFGSAATGEVHKKSDIDLLLLFNADHNPELGDEAKLVHTRAGEVERAYELVNPFSFVFANRGEDLDTDFLWQVARDGLLLYGKPERLLGSDEYFTPMLVVSYDLSDLPRKDRVYVERKLYGYRARPTYKEKEYAIEREGLVTQYGRRLGRGAFMIDARSSEMALHLLDERKVKHTAIKAWI